MPPYSEEVSFKGSVGYKRPVTGYKHPQSAGYKWLQDKRRDDACEGLWRVHDDLYDLSNFIKRHPGGPQWLELTKGTDITEAFEVHHLQEVAEKLLPKFHIKKAETPRNSPFTFKEDGFYRTLKRRVRPIIKDLPKSAKNRSAIYTDTLLASMFVCAVLACRYWSYPLAVLSGVFMGSLGIAAHNYFHQKDNLRMYFFNFCTLQYKEWRISHALSHHLYTNTIADMEMYFLEPFGMYFPREKNVVLKYISWVYSPILWALFIHRSFIGRIVNFIKTRDENIFDKSDLIPFSVPLVMYILGGQPLIATLVMWTNIVVCCSIYFALIGVNAAHHHPDIFHDGDAPREEKDWGYLQLDAVMDRTEITGSHYLVLTNFGDHCLHHLFPTLDHGLLQYIYPVFKETAKEFNADLRMTSAFQLAKGQFYQLARSKSNPQPPDLFKKVKC